ncbi:MAG TPA: hypothetical protein VGO61_07900 [Steroidobacteraceae bacterium]|jgi:uncharacterized repeat protein (TIGR01451 family)|nr:hypothetical protein [Steroidobacteraceae bacterium]
MFSSFKQFKRASVACVALGSLFVSGQALAIGTVPGTAVDNIASVNYSVGGVAQTVIRSAPGAGNSTAGAGGGSNTSFVVDRKIDLYMREVNAAATPNVAPGSTNQVTTFFVRNDGNDTQGVTAAAAAYAASVFTHTSDFAMTNVRFFVESTAPTTSCTVPTQPGGMQFTLGTDSALNIPTLAADSCTWIYVVADTPSTATNGQFSNVQLTVTARAPTTLAALTDNSATTDVAGSIDVVFADGPLASVIDQDQYAIVTAAFTVTKASAVVNDFVSASNYKAIPGAQMQYTITLANGGGAAADTVSVSDALPTLTTFRPLSYNGNASDVHIQVGAANTYCIAEAGGTDTNADGCFRTTAAGVTTLTVRNPAIPTIAAAGSVIVRFSVTIN